jgi:hypothetical protein
MHTGSRAFCFLIALAATGAECASAAVTATPTDAGHYRVEAKLVNVPRSSSNKADETIPPVVVANHVLAVLAVMHTIKLPSGNQDESDLNLTVRPDADGGFKVAFTRSLLYGDNPNVRPIVNTQQFHASIPQTSDGYHVFSLPTYAKPIPAYDADSRCLASIADAHERQLLFVKITRG